MRKIVLRILTLLLTAVLCTGLMACGSNEDIPQGMQLAVCRGATFRLFIPTTWTPNTNSGVSSGFFSLTELSMVSVTESPTTPEMTPETWWNQCEAAYQKYPGYNVVSSDESFVGDVKAYAVLFDLNYSGKACRFLTVIAVREQKVYTILFSFTAEKYDSFASDRDKILSNFRFGEPYESGKTKQIPTHVTLPAGMQLASFDEGAYRLFVPQAWVLNTKDGQTSAYVSETDRTNVNMGAYMPEQEKMSIAEFWELAKADYAEKLSGFTVLEEQIYDSAKDENWEILLGGRIADRFVFSAEVDGVTYRYCQYVCAYASMFYILTYTSTADLYDTHLGELEQIRAQVQIGY